MKNLENYLDNMAKLAAWQEFDEYDIEPDFSSRYEQRKAELLSGLVTNKRRKEYKYKTAVAAVAGVLLFGVTAFAANRIYQSYMEENGYLTKVKVTQNAETKETAGENVSQLKVDFTYLPENYVYVEKTGLFYDKEDVERYGEDGLAAVDCAFQTCLRSFDEQGNLEIDIHSTKERKEFEVENGTGYYIETYSVKNLPQQYIYVIKDNWNLALEIISYENFSEQEMISIAQGAVIGGDEGIACRVEEPWKAEEIEEPETYNEMRKEKERKTVSKNAENIHQIGERMPNLVFRENHWMIDWVMIAEEDQKLWESEEGQKKLHEKYCGNTTGECCSDEDTCWIMAKDRELDLTVDQVEYLDSLKDIDIQKDGLSQEVKDVLSRSFDENGCVKPITAAKVKEGDGVNSIDEVSKVTQKEEKVCCITFTLTNNGKEDVRYADLRFALEKVVENEGELTLVLEEEGYDTMRYTLSEEEYLAMSADERKEQQALKEGELFYVGESDSGNPQCDGVYLKAGETKTCQAVFIADAENMDKYFLVVNHTDMNGDVMSLANKNQHFIDIRNQQE